MDASNSSISPLRTAATLLFLPHLVLTLYLASNPTWGLLDADLIGGVNFGLWMAFAYAHHTSTAKSKWEVPVLFALQAAILWGTCYVDSVLKMELFFGNHTYHEKTQQAGFIFGVPTYAIFAMFPMCYASLSITDQIFPPSSKYPALMTTILLPIIDNMIFTGWDMVIDPIATFESLYRWEGIPYPGGEPRSSRNMDMEANWFGVPYGNYWSGWLFWLLPIFIGTRFIRGKTSAGSSGPGTLYDLLPLISYAAQFVWCGSIAVFGNVRNPGLALVGLWTMFLPCLIAFLSWLSRQDSGEKHANAKFE